MMSCKDKYAIVLPGGENTLEVIALLLGKELNYLFIDPQWDPDNGKMWKHEYWSSHYDGKENAAAVKNALRNYFAGYQVQQAGAEVKRLDEELRNPDEFYNVAALKNWWIENPSHHKQGVKEFNITEMTVKPESSANLIDEFETFKKRRKDQHAMFLQSRRDFFAQLARRPWWANWLPRWW